MIVAALVVLAATVVFTRDLTAGGFRWGDAPSHAMDGVLVHDWVAAGPTAWRHPVSFAERQYSFYPTLSIGRTYPPGFAVFEAFFFSLFGVSVATARFSVACFGIAAVAGVYLVARRALSTVGAACAAAALLAMPAVVHWTRQTMLEMPTLAVLIWLTYAVQVYTDKPTWRRWLAVVGLLLLAPMFKQTAVFILPVVGLIMLVQAFRRRIPWRHFAVAAAVAVTPIAVMFVLTLQSEGGIPHALEVVTYDNALTGWLNGESLLFYPMTFPEQMGWIILIAGSVGLLVSLRRFDWFDGYLLTWLLVFLLLITFIQHKQPRYLFFAYFPIAMWAGLAVDRIVCIFRRAAVPSSVVAGCVLCLLVQAYLHPTPCGPDYGDLVSSQADRIRGHIVFFEGRRDGDFIFAVRERLGPRQAVIIRGSKVLYSCAADTRWRYVSHIADSDDLAEMLNKFGFSALFVERENVTNVREAGLLMDYLSAGPTYARVVTQVLSPIRMGEKGVSRTVDVYVPQQPLERSVRFMEIPMPIASQSIRVDLDKLTAELAGIAREG